MGSHPASGPLCDAYRYYVLEAAAQQEQLRSMVVALRGAGIEAIVLKGWAAARLYPSSGLRPSRDVDICVYPMDHDAAVAVVESLEDRHSAVEVHSGLPDLPDRTVEELFDCSSLEPMGETPVRVLSAEDTLRHLCLHMLKHGVSRPLWLCDVAVMLEQLPDGFDWSRCLAGERVFSDSVRCAIGLARHLLGADLGSAPADVTAAVPRWLEDAVLRRWGTPPVVLEEIASHLARRSGLIKAIAQRWPDPITATARLKGPMNDLPRLPYQARFFARLAARSLSSLARSRRTRCPNQ